MSRPRFQKLSPTRREQILETAAKEFAARGYSGTSLNHVLEAAGLSKGAAYYYFDDKADLFCTVVKHYFFDHLAEHAGLEIAGVDRSSFWPTLVEVYRQAVLHMHESSWIAGLARAAWQLPRDARRGGPLERLFEMSTAWMRALLLRGQELGVVRADLPEELLIAILVAIDQAADQWVSVHLEELSAQQLEALSLRVLSGCRRFLEPPAEEPR